MIRRMKVSLHAVYSYLAGSRLTDTRHLGEPVELRGGLPAFIPLPIRQAIRARNVRWIRWLTSLLVSYKALEGLWSRPTLETIRNKPFVKDITWINGFLPLFWRWIFFHIDSDVRARSKETLSHLTRKSRNSRFPNMSFMTLPVSLKTGPNHPVGILGAAADAVAWEQAPLNAVKVFMEVSGQVDLLAVYSATLQRAQLLGLRLFRSIFCPGGLHTLRLGKVALKFEAAGKVRVFAIVDYWTHAALLPLHNYLFNLLRRCPTDGTFDQEAAVKSFAEEFSSEKIFSFDLSAATDNIPVALSTRILSYTLGPSIARWWQVLIVDREFKVPKGPRGADSSEPDMIRYGRGQPIGARSSWAALAITHHFVVQLAAERVGRFPYYGYRVLGDDIVIAGVEVAGAYRDVCIELEIPINNKGIISDPSLAVGGEALTNFANQYYLGKDNISPISLKEEVQIETLSQRVQSLNKLSSRGIVDFTSGVISSLIKAASSRLTTTRRILTECSLGVAPDAVRALLATLLFNESGTVPLGASPSQFQGVPFISSMMALTSPPSVLYGSVTNNSLKPQEVESTPQGSIAYEYWVSVGAQVLSAVRKEFAWSGWDPGVRKNDRVYRGHLLSTAGWNDPSTKILTVVPAPDDPTSPIGLSWWTHFSVRPDEGMALYMGPILNILSEDVGDQAIDLKMSIARIKMLAQDLMHTLDSPAQKASIYIEILELFDKVREESTPYKLYYVHEFWRDDLYVVRQLESMAERERVLRQAVSRSFKDQDLLLRSLIR